MLMLMEREKVKRAFPMPSQETLSVGQLATTFTQVMQIRTFIRGKKEFVEALKHYETGILEKGIQKLEDARTLYYNPVQVAKLLKKMKEVKTLRDKATELFFGGRLVEARVKIMQCMSLVTEADELQSKYLESKLRLQLSLIAYKMGNIMHALVEVNLSLALDGLYVNGLLHRAHLYRRSRMFGAAIYDLKKAQKMDPANRKYDKWIQEAEDAAKRHHGF